MLFFPESRFTRSIDAVTIVNPSDRADMDAEKPSSDQHEIQQVGAPVLERSVGEKKTWIQEMNPWSGTTKHGIINHFIRPFPLLAYPAVAWAALTYSVALAWLIGAGTLSSFIFQVPPYNFSPGVNGLIGLPGLSEWSACDVLPLNTDTFSSRQFCRSHVWWKTHRYIRTSMCSAS